MIIVFSAKLFFQYVWKVKVVWWRKKRRGTSFVTLLQTSLKYHCPFNAPFILSKIVHLFQAFPSLTQNPEKLSKVFLGNVPPSFPVHLNSQKFPFTSLSPTDTGTSWFSAAKLPKVFLENVPSPSPAFPPLTRVPPLSSGTARSLLPRPPRHCGGKTRKRGSHKLPEHVEKYSPLAWEIWVTWIRHGDCRRKDKMMEGNHEH